MTVKMKNGVRFMRCLFLLVFLLLLAACATSSAVRKEKRFFSAPDAVPSAAPAAPQYGFAEVRNLRVGQEGDRAIATFDLVGSAGVQEAEVIVTITIDGVKRTADQLSLAGDFGPGVMMETGKRIVWNAMKDLPPDFDGTVNWDVTAVEKGRPAGTDTGQEGGGADEMVFPARNGRVPFNHRMHTATIRDCGRCHDSGPGRIDGFGKDMAHKMCKGCHQSMKSGPTKCGECHKK